MGDARLTYIKEVYSNPGPRCLAFWYFMSGHVGSLSLKFNLSLISDDGIKLIWYMEGDQYKEWNKALIDIPPNYYLIYEVIKLKYPPSYFLIYEVTKLKYLPSYYLMYDVIKLKYPPSYYLMYEVMKLTISCIW